MFFYNVPAPPDFYTLSLHDALPISILTAAMMLKHLGCTKESQNIEAAVLEAVRQKKSTQDIGGSLGTSAVGDWIARAVAEQHPYPPLKPLHSEAALVKSKLDYFNSL